MLGDYLSPMNIREVQSLVLKNQMQCAELLNASKLRLENLENEIDSVYNKINQILVDGRECGEF